MAEQAWRLSLEIWSAECKGRFVPKSGAANVISDWRISADSEKSILGEIKRSWIVFNTSKQGIMLRVKTYWWVGETEVRAFPSKSQNWFGVKAIWVAQNWVPSSPEELAGSELEVWRAEASVWDARWKATVIWKRLPAGETQIKGLIARTKQ